MIFKLIKYPLFLVLFLLLLAFLYFFFAFVLTLIPVNRHFKQSERGVEIYVTSNGVHTDLWLPVEFESIDWRNFVDTTHFEPPRTALKYISFGWGDKEFYLETPTWADLKFSVAFKAVFLPSSAAMHVAYYENAPRLGELAKKISIEKKQYEKLVEYIRQSFTLNHHGKVMLIDCCRYPGMNDSFYEANGSFHLIKTCNEWTNSALIEAGVKTAFWAPFDKSVLFHL